MSLLFLPDVVLLNLLRVCPYKERIILESTCRRLRKLSLNHIWIHKLRIVIPGDLHELGSGFRLTSCLDTIGEHMNVLLRKCPNLQCIQFEPYRRIQVFIQASLFPRLINDIDPNLKELIFGEKYVLDQYSMVTVATTVPLLEKLTIEEPYPLLYKIRSDTVEFLRKRVKNLEPGIFELEERNGRVTEDIRLILELFLNLKVLKISNVCFEIIPFVATDIKLTESVAV